MLSIFFYLYSIHINTYRKDRLSPKNWFTSFFVLNIIRDISRTSTTYIMGLLNGLLLLTNVTKKKRKKKIYIYICYVGRILAYEFVRWTFSNVFISKAHWSASDKRWNRESCQVFIMQNSCSQRHNFHWVASSAYYIYRQVLIFVDKFYWFFISSQ